jgi:hypothetical protein
VLRKRYLLCLVATLTSCVGTCRVPSVEFWPELPVVDADSSCHCTCDPKSQSGCGTYEKCTWVVDQVDPPIGHVACVPVGEGIPIGEECQRSAPGPGGGIDECVEGAVCLDNECKQICDHYGGDPACDVNHACTVYADLFETSGSAIAGVCDPACDPLTQDLNVGNDTEACGSEPTNPTLGCYGYDQYSCGPAMTLTATDRQPPRTNMSGNAFLNGCAPGYMPFWRAETGSSAVVCAGFCAALETDNAPDHVMNGLGDADAVGKLPTTAKAQGDATCAAGKKGSEDSSRCLFLWPFVLDDETGELPLAFDESRYRDTLGICFALAHYKIDVDGDMTPETPFKDCTTLPPNSPETTGDEREHSFDDASDFYCQTVANTPELFDSNSVRQKPLALRDVHAVKGGMMELARHSLD